MPKPLVVVAVLLAIPVILLVGLNLYLRTPGVQEEIRGEIVSNVGMPVSIREIHATPLGGVRLDGILLGPETGNPLLTGDSLTIYPRFLKLLQGRFLVRELVLDHPIVRLPVNGLSSLSATSLPVQSSPVQAANTPQESSRSNGADATLTQAAPPRESSREAASPLQLSKTLNALPQLRIIDADLTLLGTNNSPIAVIHGMTLQGRGNGDGEWKGKFDATDATIGTALILHEIHSPIIISSDSKTISLNDLNSNVGGGTLQGNFSLQLPPDALQYSTTLKLSEALLNQLFVDASLGNAASEGKVTGDLQLSGTAGVGSSMEGKGNLVCTEAVIQPADFLKQIGQILQIDELQLLRIAEGRAAFTIHEGKLAINDLTLHSENLILSAQGPVLPNGDLNLNARLLFNEKMSGRLRGLLGAQMSAAPEPGYSQIQFHVAGPLNNPRTDLLERLTGIRFGGDLGGLLQGFFGHSPTH